MLDAMRKKFSARGRSERRLMARVDAVIAARPRFAGMSDAELMREAAQFKASASDAIGWQDEALALACEAAARALGLDPYPVQIAGALVLLDGGIAEMRTGEGKTLVAGLAAFAAAIGGSVHVVTVNDYLARRDAENIGRMHRLLGLTVGLAVPGMSPDEARAAYACDVVYATATQIGFDYLRDGLAMKKADLVQPERRFAIVDEVDSVLIDEARMPLIISQDDGSSGGDIALAHKIVAALSPEVRTVHEKERVATLDDDGIAAVEEALVAAGRLAKGASFYDAGNVALAHRITMAVNARFLFRKDKDYAVVNGQVKIIDQGTGRISEGRKFGEGLHQALEVKENVIQTPESLTLASVSIQNLFRGYSRLAGMTGTAATDAEEFAEIYKLDVVSIPTNRPAIRVDDPDEIYRTRKEKLAALVALVEQHHDALQPLLIGAASVERSEEIAELLAGAGFTRMDGTDEEIAHVAAEAKAGRGARMFSVLNARNHAQEAGIIARAGLPGSITVATAMAGRGTDIRLGGEAGEPELVQMAKEVGGLFVVGTERLENRRVDDQLRGRSARQGEPGRTRFLLSLEDDLMRVYGGMKKLAIMADLGEGESISHPIADKAVREAQMRLEKHHFDMRSDLVKFDDVIELQRREVQGLRSEILAGTEFQDWIAEIQEAALTAVVARHTAKDEIWQNWNLDGLSRDVTFLTGQPIDVRQACETRDTEGNLVTADNVLSSLLDLAGRIREHRLKINGVNDQADIARHFMLVILDTVWREHVTLAESYRRETGISSMSGRDPLVEYRTKTSAALEDMLDRWRFFVAKETLRQQKVERDRQAA